MKSREGYLHGQLRPYDSILVARFIRKYSLATLDNIHIASDAEHDILHVDEFQFVFSNLIQVERIFVEPLHILVSVNLISIGQ